MKCCFQSRADSSRHDRGLERSRGNTFWKGLGFFIFTAAIFLAGTVHADWQSTLTPEGPGPFPEVRPFEAVYRFGWSEIEAARASVAVTYDGGEVHLSAKGGTKALARKLYSLDVTHTSRILRAGFLPIEVAQLETYSKQKLKTQIVAKPDGFWVLREPVPAGANPAKWKRIKFAPIRDLVSGMFFIRSQRLEIGDNVSVVIYPDSSPYLVDMKVLGIEKISIGGVPKDTLKLDLRIQRINLKAGGTLEKHNKFQSGKIWLSNDADRIPLRAEVSIFIGYVFGEIVSCKFPPP